MNQFNRSDQSEKNQTSPTKPNTRAIGMGTPVKAFSTPRRISGRSSCFPMPISRSLSVVEDRLSWSLTSQKNGTPVTFLRRRWTTTTAWSATWLSWSWQSKDKELCLRTSATMRARLKMLTRFAWLWLNRKLTAPVTAMRSPMPDHVVLSRDHILCIRQGVLVLCKCRALATNRTWLETGTWKITRDMLSGRFWGDGTRWDHATTTQIRLSIKYLKRIRTTQICCRVE